MNANGYIHIASDVRMYLYICMYYDLCAYVYDIWVHACKYYISIYTDRVWYRRATANRTNQQLVAGYDTPWHLLPLLFRLCWISLLLFIVIVIKYATLVSDRCWERPGIVWVIARDWNTVIHWLTALDKTHSVFIYHHRPWAMRWEHVGGIRRGDGYILYLFDDHRL